MSVGFALDEGGDAAAAAWNAKKYARRKVLEAVPASKDGAVTLVCIAARAEMSLDAVRAQMVPLRAAGEAVRVGSGSGIDPYRYFKPNGQAPELDEQLASPEPAEAEPPRDTEDVDEETEEQEEAEVSEEITSDRVRAALPTSNTEAVTVAEIAERAGVSEVQASSVICRLFKSGEAKRVGKGGRHDPYRYFDPSYDVPVKRKTKTAAAVPQNGSGDYDAVVAQLEGEQQQLEEQLGKVRTAIEALKNLRGAA